MEIFTHIASFIIHIDVHLNEIIAYYGNISYVILFAIVFAETGLVIIPFLPGDSLLFAAGALAAIGSFDIIILFFLLWAAAFLGDTVNYSIGRYFGRKIIGNRIISINQKYIDKTQSFFDKYGGKTVFLARFFPIIRTFAPFVAGMGKMDYVKFMHYNIAGGLVWVSVFIFLGYFFGNLPGVKENFSTVVIGIVILSITPILFEIIKTNFKK